MNVKAYVVYDDGTVKDVYSDNEVKYIDDAIYETGFENSSKGLYDVNLVPLDIDGLTWYLNDALLGSLAGDVKEGTKSVRFRNSGEIYTAESITNLYKISFSVAKFGSDSNASVFVDVSANGVNWINVTDAIDGSGIPVTTTTLERFNLVLTDSETFNSSSISDSSSLFVSIYKSGGNRVNLDELGFYSIYSGISHLVTMNDEGSINKILVKDNSYLSAEYSPTKEGYSFDGWYTDVTLTALYNFNTEVTSSFTLYAKWEETAPVDSQSLTITLSSLGASGGSYANNTPREFTVDNYSFEANTWLPNSGNIQGQANNFNLYNLDSLGQILNLTLTLTGASAHTVYAGTSQNPDQTVITSSISSNVYTYDFSNQTYEYFKIQNNSSAIYIVSIVVEYIPE
jgi:uncharacterized repeat protein (TIGR02543 family)